MKKLLFILPIAVVMLVLQGCPDFKADQIDYFFQVENPERWIDIQPKKEVYNVGDTIEITYKIPSHIGEYVAEESKEDIVRYFGVQPENFKLRDHFKKDSIDFIDYHLPYKSRKTLGFFQNIEKTIILINEGKEVEIKNNGLQNALLKYRYDKEKEEYIAQVKVIFIKPDTFYWLNGYNKESSLSPLSAQASTEGNNDYYYSSIIIKFSPKDDIAFEVVE
ncbi:hypothetical protein GO491_03850 [Flavobacteriaceae bacterium Ap0902]|nr:hypothetical protein [Flavobacteriaceae bacterium Ap0902]